MRYRHVVFNTVSSFVLYQNYFNLLSFIGGEPQQATSLTAIAMTEENADTIHVELNPITTLKFVRIYSGVTEVVEFHDQFWLDFNGNVDVLVKYSQI